MMHRTHRYPPPPGSSLATISTCLRGLVCLWVLWAVPSLAQPEVDEDPAKTALVYAFAKFVQWPEGTFPAPTTPFVIGVIDNPAMLEALQPLTQKRMHGRAVEVVSLESPDAPERYQILYCSRAQLEDFADTHPERLSADHILTVGEEEGFAENGGILRLMVVDDHLGFVVNSTAAKRAGLGLSSSLYHLAHAVLEESD